MATLEIIRTFAGPREQVWRAFTDPVALDAWFWPHLAAVAQTDLRVDGSLRITATRGPSDDFGITGRYVEVVPPSRLVFTWRWNGEPEETLVMLTLDEVVGGGTTMRIVHDRFADEAVRDVHIQGWNDCLDRLPELLAGAETGV